MDRRLDFARGAELAFLVFAGLALAGAVYRFGALWSGVIGAAMLSAAIGSSMAAYKTLGLLFDPAYAIAALTCLYIATTVFRYFQTETERTRVRDTFGRISPMTWSRGCSSLPLERKSAARRARSP